MNFLNLKILIYLLRGMGLVHKWGFSVDNLYDKMMITKRGVYNCQVLNKKRHIHRQEK